MGAPLSFIHVCGLIFHEINRPVMMGSPMTTETHHIIDHFQNQSLAISPLYIYDIQVCIYIYIYYMIHMFYCKPLLGK